MQPIVAKSRKNLVIMRSKDGKSFSPWCEMTRASYIAAGGEKKLREVCKRKKMFFSVLGPKRMEATNA